MPRASRVERDMCGCTSTQRITGGTGICLMRGLSMPTVSTSPPNSDGAMLSTCIEPLATCSPCIANFSNSIVPAAGRAAHSRRRPRRRPRLPTHLAPSPAGCPSRCAIQADQRVPRSFHMASTRRPAVLRSGFQRQLCGDAAHRPECAHRKSALRRAVTRSPSASTEWPRMSKPMATLPTDAGANAVASLRAICSQLGTQIGAHAQQVGEHAAGGHFRACTRALHDERVVAITARRQSARCCP